MFSRRFTWLSLALSMAAFTGCEAPLPMGEEPSSTGRIPAAPPDFTASCDGESDGEPCSMMRHCVDERCVHNRCGDGVVAGREECDDGNAAHDDGCSPSCRMEPGPRCGDGRMDEGEECDDGNLQDDDGCSVACTIVECGNGRKDPTEDCDDGDDDDDDYCTRRCERSLCRNGKLNPGEQCDDGNAIHDDGCTNACQLIGCGDGVVEVDDPSLLEECDDGNDVDDDDCSNACTHNECGNKRIDPGEVCDGDTMGDQVCNETCDAYLMDACGLCMKENCDQDFPAEGAWLEVSSTFRGAYESCYVDYAMEDVLIAAGWVPDFADRCRAYDECVRRSDCYDYDSPMAVVPCFCTGASLSECQTDPELLNGPCIREANEANYGCATENDGQCLTGSVTDVGQASGFVNMLAQCRHDLCADECF